MSHSRFAAPLIGLAAICFKSIALSAQAAYPIDRGSYMVSGSAHVSSTNNNNGAGTATTLSISPAVMYFVAPGMAFGGQAAASYGSTGSVTSRSWLLGPAARLYFGDAGDRLFPHIGASAFIRGGRAQSDVTGSTSVASFTGWGAEASGGLTRMLSRQVGVHAEAFLSHSLDTQSAFTPAVKNSVTSYGMRFGISAFIY